MLNFLVSSYRRIALSSSATRSSSEELLSAEGICIAEIAKLCQDAKRSYEVMSKYAIEHDTMRPRDWCTRIMNHPMFLGLHTKLRFVRILNYSTTSGPLFVFAEHTEPVLPDAIQRLCGDWDLCLSMIPPEREIVTIKELLSPQSTYTSSPHIITSKSLSRKDIMVVVQYDDSHTVRIPKRIFDDITNHYPNVTGSLSSVTIVRSSGSVLQRMSMEDWKQQAISRIEFLEEAEVSYSDTENLQRLTNRAKYENLTSILQKHSDDLEDIRQRIGPLHESVVRLRLEATRGSEWGRSKTIFGLFDIFSFVAAGLNATPAQRKKATTKLYTLLINGFENWNYNPKNLKLSDIDFNAVTPFPALFTDSLLVVSVF